MSTAKDHKLGIFLVAVLAAASVRLDEIYYRKPVLQELWPDWLIAVILAFAATVVLIGTRRLLESREQIRELARRTSGLADAAWIVSRGGQTDSILKRVAEQACSIIGVERATICVRDRNDPRSSIVVAGHGVREDLIDTRLGIDEGIVGSVFLSGEPVIVTDYHDFPENSGPGGSETRAGGSAPIRYQGEVRGALTVGTANPEHSFGRHELDSLRRLADLGSMALEQAQMRTHLELAVGSGVEALTEAIDMRDHYTWQHSKNVMELAGKLGKRLGLDEAALAELAFAARLHDVGKIGVPDTILLKAGTLNDDEWDVMKQYPLRGAEILERVPGLGNVAQIVLCEHEHWDGSGYPQGRAGEDIPLASRIILACDAFDAMTSDRPWRSALKPWAAVREMRAGAGREFDPQVVVQLIGVLRESRTTTALATLLPTRVRQSS
jgi:HD-GYP domain-containing protein (c-di-GMP phosphodiesterase class II)